VILTQRQLGNCRSRAKKPFAMTKNIVSGIHQHRAISAMNFATQIPAAAEIALLAVPDAQVCSCKRRSTCRSIFLAPVRSFFSSKEIPIKSD
jgi:hypothetical protein